MTMTNTTMNTPSHSLTKSHWTLRVCMAGLLSITLFAPGCSTLSGIPVSRVPRELLYAEQKDDFNEISMLRLRQDPPPFYALGPGDVLGVFIKGVIGDENQLPPVHYPEDPSQPPAVGYPTPVREDGTLSLPIVKPINVEGLSIIEATERVRQAYIGGPAPILPPDSEVSLTMIRARMVRVLVIREEAGGNVLGERSKRGTGHIVDLPAYENDLLNALNRTGGLPGIDAENQILIYRGLYQDGVDYDRLLNSSNVSSGYDCEDQCFCDESPLPDPPHVTRVPLRYHPTNPPNFNEEDIVLNDSDIVIIRSRDTETFYTAGLLGGGEHLLPRDKDLDVVAAVSMVGGQLGNSGTGVMALSGGASGGGGRGGGGGGGQGGGYCQASEVLVIRELPCGDQITIKIDLEKALQNTSERLLIQPNDVVLLRYKLSEEIANVLLSLIQFNFLFNGFGGSGF